MKRILLALALLAAFVLTAGVVGEAQARGRVGIRPHIPARVAVRAVTPGIGVRHHHYHVVPRAHFHVDRPVVRDYYHHGYQPRVNYGYYHSYHYGW